MLCNKSHRNEQPVQLRLESGPSVQLQKSPRSNKDPPQPKQYMNEIIFLKTIKKRPLMKKIKKKIRTKEWQKPVEIVLTWTLKWEEF